jgi:hypothetical protein
MLGISLHRFAYPLHLRDYPFDSMISFQIDELMRDTEMERIC